MIVKKKEPPVS